MFFNYPYMVLTSILHPKTASIIDIYSVLWASIPTLCIVGWGLTCIFISRSPFRWPLPLNLSVWSLSIPFGTVIYSLVSLAYIPKPLQLVQGVVIFFPSPWHELQGVLKTIIPCLIVVKPVPWQLPHFCGWVPGFDLFPLQVEHVHFLLNFIVYFIF